ncbi:hypothetical protein [Cohnella zeiphila]|uniref:Uncharacterized protein n=1 Tax=Cohnella zeiphila TaxID=2761120 RepID=A0A7X0SKD0_9BACL|nr:hypothetical protein [Cohnella zeiphila]MBB6730409.1 hypothetical protein [Cohnella zeiphila]
MTWLIVAVVVVMAAGLVATLMIGQSKSNKEENAGYMQNTGKKWGRLGGIYLLVIVVVVICLIALLNQ